MGIKDILVHLDNSSASRSRLDLAITYARRHGARVRGLYLITHHFYEPSSLGEKKDKNNAEKMFTEMTTAAGISAEWIFLNSTVMGSNVSDLITLYAYYTDLVVIGQVDLSAPAAHTPVDLAERVALTCGRPVLIVPYVGTFKTAGERISVAWRAGRESIRAVNDALPIMKIAHTITVTEIEAHEAGRSTSLEAVKDFLGQHTIKATIETISAGNIPVGDMLLNNVCEKNCDLLIMGAFAPNRRGVLEVSPVTRHIVKHLTAPLLISH